MAGNNQSAAPNVFGLEKVPLPAIVTDKTGDVVWANERFRAVSGKSEIRPGTDVRRLLSIAADSVAPLDFSAPEQMVRRSPRVVIEGERFDVHVEPMGLLVGCVFTSVSHRDGVSNDAGTSASKLPPAANRILDAFYRLSAELNRGTEEDDDVILMFVRVYQDLFPDRLLCIKLFDQETNSFQQVYANARLKEESHATVRLSRRSVVEHGLDTAEGKAFLRSTKVTVTYEYLPIFEDGVDGFDIPLFDGTSFYGILNFEYWKNPELLQMDRTIAVPVGHQMSMSLRYASLISEITFLKDYLEKLLDQANAPVLVVDGERRITVFNQAMERQTG